MARQRTASAAPHVLVSLDDAPRLRWAKVAPAFRQFVPGMMEYIRSEVPAWALPVLDVIGAAVRPYFGEEYGGEMEGLAEALGMRTGYLVFLNLIMQVEEIGINCSNWNTTGPTRKDDPGCVDVDPTQSFCYCKKAVEAGGSFEADGSLWLKKRKPADGPGLCTSIVAQDPAGQIYHGRNLDWNMPEAVRKLIADVTFTRNGKAVFTGTGAIGFVGNFNGMVDGAYSVSINARGKGGKLLTNILQALLHKSTTPCMHLRSVLTNEANFTSAVAALSQGAQIDENYFIVAGVQPAEGAVIARGRAAAVDTWMLEPAEPNGWFRLETNYDHTNPVPVADDRRTPGNANMIAMGQVGLARDSLKKVLLAFPTFNPHTDYTAVMIPKSGYYNSTIWMD